MLKQVLARLLRASVASGLGFLFTRYMNDPVYGVVLTPLLMTAGKWIRVHWPNVSGSIPV